MFVNAKPIWINEEPTPNTYACFYDEFTAEGSCCRLLVAADSHYAVWVNGEYVYAYQFADDEERRVYDEIDISAYAHEGVNRVEIGAYCTLTDSSVYKAGKPYLIYEIFAGAVSLAHSGAQTLSCKNPAYVSGPVPLITGQLGYTFHMNAEAAEAEKICARETGDVYAFVKRPVKSCVMLDKKASRQVSQGVFMDNCQAGEPLGQRMQKAFLSYREPDTLTDEYGRSACGEGDGIYFLYDLGEEETGFLDIAFDTEEACEVLVGWGEHTDDLRVRAYVGTRNFVCTLRAKKGENRFFHPYRRLGLRYLQVHVYAKKVKMHYATVRPVRYPLPEGARLVLKDQLHQKIYDTCVHTLRLCMHEHYEDCPWREQALYAMDSRNQMLAGYYVFGEYDFAKASLETLARSLRGDHLLELCAPARVAVNIPSFSLMFVVAVWEYLLYSGDRAFAGQMLSVAEEIVANAAARIGKNGLAPRYSGAEMWNFYEWSEHLDGQDAFLKSEKEDRFDAPLNAFLSLALSRLALICKALGNEKKSSAYADAHERLNEAIHQSFYDPTTGCYYTYTDEAGNRYSRDELTQALCVYVGACPADETARACTRLTDGSMTPVTLAYSIFKYEALLIRGGCYGEWVKKDVERLWGSMLYKGGTAFFETIRAGDDFDRAGSLCHGWSAVPAYLYFAYALGAKPEDVGWSAFGARPVNGAPEIEDAKIRLADGRFLDFPANA